MKKNSDHPVLAVVVFTGIFTLATQLLMVRECIAQFSGNEFVITLILFCWLILGGLGNRLAHLINKHFLPATNIKLAWMSLLLAAAPVFVLYAVRCLRDVVFIHGSAVGFYPTFLYILLCMAPYGLLVGIALPYSLFVLKKETPGYPGTLIYLADNLGNIFGGVLFSFVLIFLATPFQALFITGVFVLISVVFLLRPLTTGKWPVYMFFGIVFLIQTSALFFENASLSPSGGNLVYYKESRFGRIAVHQNREQYTLFEDGNPVVTSSNIPYAEQSVHYALSQVKDPKQILLIGARSGTMAEIQKYQPQGIDYVELNPDMTAVLFQYQFIHDLPGITNIIHQDGRFFLSKTDNIYDAILVSLPDPTTFQINRFFTDRFFSLVKQHLAKGGVFSFSTPGFDNYLSEPLRQKLSSLYNTASDYFSHVTLLPGDNIYFLCRDYPVQLDIPDRLSEKNISTLYISRFYKGNLTPDRIDELKTLIDPSTPKNKDLSPHLIRLMFREWFSLHQTSPKGFVIAAAIFGIVYLILMKKTEFVLFTTGFVTMGSEILTIFAVQIFFGYIYSQIGLIVTVFLAGLFPGAWLGSKWNGDRKKLLAAVDGGIIILLLIFTGGVGLKTATLSLYHFIVFGLLISLGCGCQFPLALHLIKDNEPGAVKSFSADLIGAAFGTLLTSLLFIPIIGIIGTAWALIGIKCISLISLVKAPSNHPSFL